MPEAVEGASYVCDGCRATCDMQFSTPELRFDKRRGRAVWLCPKCVLERIRKARKKARKAQERLPGL